MSFNKAIKLYQRHTNKLQTQEPFHPQPLLSHSKNAEKQQWRWLHPLIPKSLNYTEGAEDNTDLET